jgi:hypothetical protein
MQVHVLQPGVESRQQFARGVVFDLEIRMADVEVQSQPRNLIEELRQLVRCVEGPWQVFNHQTDSRSRQQHPIRGCF